MQVYLLADSPALSSVTAVLAFLVCVVIGSLFFRRFRTSRQSSASPFAFRIRRPIRHCFLELQELEDRTAPAVTLGGFVDNFDDNDISDWTAGNGGVPGQVSVLDGAVAFTGPSSSFSNAFIARSVSLTGDFVLTADFTQLAGNGTPWRQGIQLQFGPMQVLFHDTDSPSDWYLYLNSALVYSGNVGGSAGAEATKTIKIIRSGQLFSFSVTRDGKETVVVQRSFAVGALTEVRLRGWSHFTPLNVRVDNFQLLVPNQAPANLQVSINATSITENESAILSGSFYDPNPIDAHQVAVDWGDGAATVLNLAAGVQSFQGITHHYLDNPAGQAQGSYRISVTVADMDGAQASAVTQIQVRNAAPALQLTATDGGVRGQTQLISVSADDPSVVDDAAGFTYSVQWGDGSSTVISPSAGNGSGLLIGHLFSAADTYTIQVTATDKDGAISATAMNVVTIGAVAVQPDPWGTTALIVGGTSGDDKILINPVGNTGRVRVSVNGASLGSFGPVGRIIVYAQGGNDDVQVAGAVTTETWQFGGDGNDRLNGGNGSNVLFGDAGNDQLLGGNGRDFIVGGSGFDRIVGNGGDDILIGGRTAFDANIEAITAIIAEWNSGRDYAQRLANLLATGTGSHLNDGFYLQALAAQPTVFLDFAQDVLTGSAGRDWFFSMREDRFTDRGNDEGAR